MTRVVHSNEVKAAVLEKLAQRGVTLEDIALIVLELQRTYHSGLTMEMCMESVVRVLEKRELQHAVLVGIELDVLAEKGLLSEPLLSIIKADEGLFGCDETLALGSLFGYGSIALTTFGYLDKLKVGIIEKLDNKTGPNMNSVHTFLDDLVASIAASAASRIAHKLRDRQEREAEVPMKGRVDIPFGQENIS